VELDSSNTKIAVFGGGRWARVLLGILISSTKPGIKFSVHTNLEEDMQEWIDKRNLRERIFVTNNEPDFNRYQYMAAVVANSSNSHKKSAEIAIAAKIPVLVEKPMTPSLIDTYELVEIAKKNKTLLSSSLVFLHASYIDNFINKLGSIDTIKKVYFNWTDTFSESRHGEIKSYDSATPIFKDVLPHMLSILSKILKNNSFELIGCNVSCGGSCVHIVILISNIECCLKLERNSDKRRREIFIKGHKNFELDFSTEPGIIKADGQTYCGDINWSSSPSPLEKMISEFLSDIKLDKFNQESNINLALSISKLIDQVEPLYLKSLDKWFIEYLNQKEVNNKDIHYFLSELVIGTLKVSYDKREALIIRYLRIISSGQFLYDYQNSNTELVNNSISKFISSLKIN